MVGIVVSVNPRFIEDFNLCMEFYGCTEEEAKYEKKRVLKSYDEAERCYSIIASWIRGSSNVR